MSFTEPIRRESVLNSNKESYSYQTKFLKNEKGLFSGNRTSPCKVSLLSAGNVSPLPPLMPVSNNSIFYSVPQDDSNSFLSDDYNDEVNEELLQLEGDDHVAENSQSFFLTSSPSESSYFKPISFYNFVQSSSNKPDTNLEDQWAIQTVKKMIESNDIAGLLEEFKKNSKEEYFAHLLKYFEVDKQDFNLVQMLAEKGGEYSPAIFLIVQYAPLPFLTDKNWFKREKDGTVSRVSTAQGLVETNYFFHFIIYHRLESDSVV